MQILSWNINGLADHFPDDEGRVITMELEEGLTDVFRALYPGEISFTWWSNRLNKRKQDRGWQPDYFFVDKYSLVIFVIPQIFLTFCR